MTVESAEFSVFVDGSVLRSGQITSNHPMTVLEAIMNAGGFDYSRADTAAVEVIRLKPGDKAYTHIIVDLKAVIGGTEGNPVYLAPGDIVHVPEKISWF